MWPAYNCPRNKEQIDTSFPGDRTKLEAIAEKFRHVIFRSFYALFSVSFDSIIGSCEESFILNNIIVQ